MTELDRPRAADCGACRACAPRRTSGWSPRCSGRATGTPGRATTARCCPTGDGRRSWSGGEAILPAFVAADPYGAGVAAVLANVNDLAAMGAAPLALLDTVVGTEDISREVAARDALGRRALRRPARRRAPHAHRRPAGAVGLRHRPGRRACCPRRTPRAGQVLVLGCCIEGAMRSDFLFFPSFDERGGTAGRRRPAAGRAGRGGRGGGRQGRQHGRARRLAGHAARARPARRDVDLDVLPVPDGVPLADWLACFPCFAFLLCCPPARGQRRACGAFARPRPRAAVARRARRHRPVRLRRGDEIVDRLRPQAAKA